MSDDDQTRDGAPAPSSKPKRHHKSTPEGPITEQELLSYAEAREDLNLELRALFAANVQGFEGRHGGTYVDPLTNKFRQYDVRAWFEKDGCRLDVAIECKTLSQLAPLLVSRVMRRSGENAQSFIVEGRERIETRSVQLAFPPGHGLYPLTEPVGKSLSQVRRKDGKEGGLTGSDDELHDKWVQAVSSCQELIADARSRVSQPGRCTAVLPILAVSDGTLWAVDYAPHGPMVKAPRRVEQTTLYVGRKLPISEMVSFEVSHLHICTLQGLTQLLGEFHHSPLWAKVIPVDMLAQHRTRIVGGKDASLASET